MGHEDGCISFWHIRDDDKPIMVRTLDSLDIEKPVSDPALLELHRPPREPIFKLTWSAFPEKSWMDMASESAASWQTQQRQRKTSSIDATTESIKGTVLTVLGGAKADLDPPGLFCAICRHIAQLCLYWAPERSRQITSSALRFTPRSCLRPRPSIPLQASSRISCCCPEAIRITRAAMILQLWWCCLQQIPRYPPYRHLLLLEVSRASHSRLVRKRPHPCIRHEPRASGRMQRHFCRPAKGTASSSASYSLWRWRHPRRQDGNANTSCLSQARRTSGCDRPESEAGARSRSLGAPLFAR